jgi:hypothetical protein
MSPSPQVWRGGTKRDEVSLSEDVEDPRRELPFVWDNIHKAHNDHIH